MFISVSVASFSLMLFFWFIAQLAFLIYGLATDQFGFILLFLFNIVISFIGIFIKMAPDEEDEDDN
jgi:hypothetical protein